MARRFVDAHGTEWEVWEVTGRPVYADRAPRPWVPEGASAESARLRFESVTQSRLLTRYPTWWLALEDRELAALCAAAQLEQPAAVRRIAVGLAGLR
jgi:hypothetical protein